MKKNFSLKKRVESFKYAFNGFRILLKEEHNARIHFAVATVVVILGFIFHISVVEWLFVCSSIGFVIVAESINSAIEALSDYISPEWDSRIKKVKDLSAFAVLFAVLVSVVIGGIIFFPRIIDFSVF